MFGCESVGRPTTKLHSLGNTCFCGDFFLARDVHHIPGFTTVHQVSVVTAAGSVLVQNGITEPSEVFSDHPGKGDKPMELLIDIVVFSFFFGTALYTMCLVYPRQVDGR